VGFFGLAQFLYTDFPWLRKDVSLCPSGVSFFDIVCATDFMMHVGDSNTFNHACTDTSHSKK